jgi:putative flippase GtrA
MTGDNTGAANASTFTKMHINCSNTSHTPSSNSIGIDLSYGDGNTFVGGDVEDCADMLHLGSGATSNTIAGLRWENSTAEVVADSGSQYNLLLTGSTIHTGKLTDAGTHNTFWDAFHNGVNNLNGNMWRSQADATVTNHVYTGVGLGHVRGIQDEYVTDVPGTASSYQNAWLWGPGDGTTGLQLWSLLDMLNNVQRIGVQQYTTAGGNNQSFLNAAGTGSVCFNCSTNSGTGGTNFGSGGSSPTTVASFDATGNQTINGYLRFLSSGTEAWRFNCASATACALDDWTTGSSLHRLRFYANAGTDIDSGNTSAVTVNNTSTAGTGGMIVYGGGAYYATKLISVTQSSGVGVYLLPGIASSSNYNCTQVDSSGYLSNTGSACFNSTMSITGNAATATALQSAPTLCSTGYAPTGILASGNATGCAAISGGGGSGSGTATWSGASTYLSPSVGTQYVGVASVNTGSRTDPWVAPRAGTVQSCAVSVNIAYSSSNNYTFKLYKNGAVCTSGPTMTTNGAQYTAVVDNTHTCTVAQGDLLTWQAVAFNASTTASLPSLSCLY